MADTVPVHEGLFVERPEGARLIGGVCAACGRQHFPRLTSCPYCAAADCEEKLLGPRGSLFLYTVVVNRPPGYRGELPFGFGVVELPEGIRLIGRLTEPRLDRLRLGMPMRVVVAPLHTDDEGRQVVSYAFAPEVADGG
jgi:uncharacterized OB-fold protein